MNTTFDLCDTMTENTGKHYFHPVILLKNDPPNEGLFLPFSISDLKTQQ